MLRHAYSAAAERDLLRIADYESDFSAKRAHRVLDDIAGAIELLREFPRFGHTRADLPQAPLLLAWNVSPYVVLYHADGAMMYVERIVHESMDFTALEFAAEREGSSGGQP